MTRAAEAGSRCRGQRPLSLRLRDHLRQHVHGLGNPRKRFALQSWIGKALRPKLHGQMAPSPFLGVTQFEHEPFDEPPQAGVDVRRGQRKFHAPAFHRVAFGSDRHRDLGLALEISVDRAGTKPGLLNDVLNGCRMKTFARKACQRGIQDAPALLVGARR